MAFDWAGTISGIEGLEPTRELWFHPCNKALYTRKLPFKPGMSLLDIGCGPGAFTRRVYEWFDGNINITGADLDEFFIDYCRETAQKHLLDIRYEVTDAVGLMFPENSFDMTVSYTVADHVDTVPFFSEQFRVLRPGGTIAVMYVDGFRASPGNMIDYIPQIEETAPLMKTIYTHMSAQPKMQDGIQYRKHRKPEPEYLRLLAECGFTDLRFDCIKLHHSPDCTADEKTARLIIDAWFSNDIDMARSTLRKPVPVPIRDAAVRLAALLEQCKQARVDLWEKGVKLWDSVETDTIILQGRK